MKWLISALLIVFCIIAQAQDKPAIIFDTDIGPDYDDVGAMAMLHAFADKGECEILATIASNRYNNTAAVLDVLNTYFRRADLPIGVVRGESPEIKVSQKWDSVLVKKYPHDLKNNDQAEDATVLYRKLLAASGDNSVTIVTVGFLTNMSNLLKSSADQYSQLDGLALVKKKVKRLVCMAGRFPAGNEFNVRIDTPASKYTFERWPGEVIFTGWEIGMKIYSGLPLIKSAINNSPVKDVFAISIPMSDEDKNGRKSWDQTAVLIAVRGAGKYYNVVEGKFICNDDGTNAWDPAGKGHFYVTEKEDAAKVEKIINDLMMHQPAKK